ncbi:MAG: hypothetical protein ACTSUL_05075 [Promethearchaeota archaeon]
MSDQLKLILYIKDMISDLIYINSIIATELVKINENLVAMRRGEEFLNSSSCIPEHETLNKHLMEIVEKYNKTEINIPRKDALKKHILKHSKS